MGYARAAWAAGRAALWVVRALWADQTDHSAEGDRCPREDHTIIIQ